MKKTYSATIPVDKKRLAKIEEMFGYTCEDMAAHNIPTMTALETLTATFADGWMADIKICSSDSDIWSEGVLFTNDGYEVTHTEVCDSLAGEWKFATADADYIVTVVGK